MTFTMNIIIIMFLLHNDHHHHSDRPHPATAITTSIIIMS
jgi:hypothetical protein